MDNKFGVEQPDNDEDLTKEKVQLYKLLNYSVNMCAVVEQTR